MKVMSYSYMSDGHLQHLFVDEDLDRTLLPTRIKDIVDTRTGIACGESVIAKFGITAKEKFHEEGYLEQEIFNKFGIIS